MRIIRNAEEKETQLMCAFKELTEGENLGSAKAEIEKELNRFISYLHKKLKVNQRVFENLESRIKGEDSFREKMHRREYLKKWEVTDDVKHNINLIAKNLTDLIGFRLTCFFLEDEEEIYELLRQYSDSGEFNEIQIDFKENCEQKNGHKIYKVSGKYKNEYSFELQIKAIMHNIWGEVEHKTIYKNKHYDPNIETKRTITEQLFNILKASDKQLVSLFEVENTEKKLLQSLFFVKTKEQIAEEIKTYILAEHYDRFFELFLNETYRDYGTYQHIKEYVAMVLQENEYCRKEPPLVPEVTNNKELVKAIEDTFYEYDLQALYYIASIIYCFQSYEEFLSYLPNYIISSRIDPSINDSEENVDFDDSEDNDESGNSEIEKIDNVINILEKIIGRRKK